MSGDKSVLSAPGCLPKARITAAIWGELEDFIITGTEKGELNMLDVRTGDVTKTIKAHSGVVTDLQMHIDKTMFISASKDHTAKVRTDQMLAGSSFLIDSDPISLVISFMEFTSWIPSSRTRLNDQ